MLLPPLPQALDLWLPAWFRQKTDPLNPLGARHVLFTLTETWAPDFPAVPAEQLRRWAEAQQGPSGRPTLFWPLEALEEARLSALAELHRETGCEVELWQREAAASPAALRERLLRAREALAGHGLLAREEEGARFGFINGPVAAGRPGLPPEQLLPLLREAGAYADFTYPTAPHRTQPRAINCLQYARGRHRARASEQGRRICATRAPRPPEADELLQVPGPLVPDWAASRWLLFPAAENGVVTPARPPTRRRFRLWLESRVSILGRPNWLIIKLHHPAASLAESTALHGAPMQSFRQSLAAEAARDPQLRCHFVSARELVNIILAAEAGHSGDPMRFRDFRYTLAGAAQPA